MRNYNELVEALRKCSYDDHFDCPICKKNNLDCSGCNPGAEAADAIEELLAELYRKQTIRARHKIRFDYDRLVKDTNIEKIIREKLMAQVFDLLFDKQNLYSMSKESLQDGSVLYELELSIMPPALPKEAHNG